MTPVQKPAAAK